MEAESVPRRPAALFIGDFNVGKSATINALVRRRIFPTACQETTAVPALVGRWPDEVFGRIGVATQEIEVVGLEVFEQVKLGSGRDSGCKALLAGLPGHPYYQLVLIDSPGLSSMLHPEGRFHDLLGSPSLMIVVLVDVEYWAARHTFELLRELSAHHRDLVVVANKADQLNHQEIRRIQARAPLRMAGQGVRQNVPFLLVSARLEGSRRKPDPYREATQTSVRQLCDAGFDALRLQLFEFEAANLDGAGQRGPWERGLWEILNRLDLG